MPQNKTVLDKGLNQQPQARDKIHKSMPTRNQFPFI